MGGWMARFKISFLWSCFGNVGKKMVECRVGSNFLYLSWGKLMDAMEATNWHRWGGLRIHLKIN